MKKTLLTMILVGTLGVANAQFSNDTINKFKPNDNKFLKNWVGLNEKDGKNPLGNYVLSSSLLFTSGFLDGTAETLQFHYSHFKKRFPNANDQFWNPDLSWTNKYKNGNVEDGEKFPLSTTSLIGLTDGYHMMRTGRNLTMVTGITITLGEKRKFKHYLMDGLIKFCVYSAGFTLAYDGMFRK